MINIGFKNFRRLRDVEPIKLKKINILVGRNSSGKSTFLRSLPLLRQSTTTKIRTPLLWYGEDVDFGSFEGAVYRNDTALPITFCFGFDDIKTESVMLSRAGIYYHSKPTEIGSVTTSVSISPIKDLTYVSRIIFDISGDNDKLEILFSDQANISKVLLNSVDVTSIFSSYELKVVAGGMIPRIIPIFKRQNIKIGERWERNNVIMFSKEIEDIIQEIGRKNQSKLSLGRIVDDLLGMWPVSKQNLAQALKKINFVFWNNFADEITNGLHEENYKKIKTLLILSKLFPMVQSISERIDSIASQVMYIGPMRARSDRYYRYQDLSVSQIDADGKNFPMFLNSLTDSQLSDFGNWVESLYGYKVVLNKPAGHISIDLIVKGARSNIVDTGYGVSQILPVLGQIWWAHHKVRSRGQERTNRILAIEQPELHLHPAHQALLADSLASSGKWGRAPGRRSDPAEIIYIVETHSEALINRLGELVIGDPDLDNKVQILLFEQDDFDDRATTVRTVPFASDGTLIDWPYGFFQPDF